MAATVFRRVDTISTKCNIKRIPPIVLKLRTGKGSVCSKLLKLKAYLWSKLLTMEPLFARFWFQSSRAANSNTDGNGEARGCELRPTGPLTDQIAGSIAPSLWRQPNHNTGLGRVAEPFSFGELPMRLDFCDACRARKLGDYRAGAGLTPEARALGYKAATERADASAIELAPVVKELQAAGTTSLRGIADELNRRGIPRGRYGFAGSVSRLQRG